MDWIQSTIKNGLFPLHEAIKGHTTYTKHRQLMASQWWAPSQIQRLQNFHYDRFIKEVIKHVPFYRAYESMLFERELSPERLSEFPLTSKALIRENFEWFRNTVSKQLTLRSTGGSTGEPFKFLLGKSRISHDVAARRRAQRWWGVDIGDKEFVLWGAINETQSQPALKRVRDFLIRSEFHSVQGLDHERALYLLREIFRTKPRMLFSYPSILSYLAQVAKQEVMVFEQHPKVAFVTSEVLEPMQRTLIQQQFGCKLANGYSGRESGFIAHECPAGGMHLSSEDIIVEILDAKGQPVPDGAVGQVVITHLQSSDFPFIRYQTGDQASLSTKPCPCGRGLPLLEQLEGRISDLIYTEMGSVVHRSEIIQALSTYPEILQFRFEQNTIEHSDLYYIGERLNDARNTELLHDLKGLLGQKIHIALWHCDTLPRDPSGKHRFVVSNIEISNPVVDRAFV